MEFLGHFRRLTPVQRNTFIACFLGWSLDAFDFFILIFCVNALAVQFQTKVSAITEAIFLTLAMRPIGAFLFGLMADRFGRRPALMIDIIAYSVFELASAFAPSLKFFLSMRAFSPVCHGCLRPVRVMVALCLALALSPCDSSAQPAPAKEYQVKAVFLFNFAQFVEWPAETPAGGETNFVIGVLGDDPFGAFLDKTVEGEKVNNRTLHLSRNFRI